MFMSPPPTAPVELVVGQKYACRSSHEDRKLEAVVGKVDVMPNGASVVSISIEDHAPGARFPVIGHMPFEVGVFRLSCPNLVGTGAVGPLFADGYRQWSEARGGYFTISVDLAIDYAIKTMAEGAAQHD